MESHPGWLLSGVGYFRHQLVSLELLPVLEPRNLITPTSAVDGPTVFSGSAQAITTSTATGGVLYEDLLDHDGQRATELK